MDMKLEVVVIPVSDVDRAKQFYESLGWRLDADFAVSDDFRIVQLTPPGSGCSIQFGTGVTAAAAGLGPGAVPGRLRHRGGPRRARRRAASRSVRCSTRDAGARFAFAGTNGRVSGPAPDRSSYGSFASFSDPDGNGWLLQEITERLPGRDDTREGGTTHGRRDAC